MVGDPNPRGAYTNIDQFETREVPDVESVRTALESSGQFEKTFPKADSNSYSAPGLEVRLDEEDEEIQVAFTGQISNYDELRSTFEEAIGEYDENSGEPVMRPNRADYILNSNKGGRSESRKLGTSPFYDPEME